jgi:hypothetical protein
MHNAPPTENNDHEWCVSLGPKDPASWINAFPLQLKLGREGVFKATIAFMKLLGLNIILRESCKFQLDPKYYNSFNCYSSDKLRHENLESYRHAYDNTA